MDTPGILWPKFEDKTVGINLAVTGAIKDEIIDTVELASICLSIFSKTYPENIKKRYKLESLQDKKGYELLEERAKREAA